MAVSPASATLATWLGTGAGIAATTTTAGSHFVVPKAGVQAYVGNDAVLTDDIRDFLHSCLAKTYDTYASPKASTDTAPTTFNITRSFVKQADGKFQIVYTVSINNIVNAPANPLNIDALPTYA